MDRMTALFVRFQPRSANGIKKPTLSQNNIVNAERRGKRQVLIRPSSKVVVKFLGVMQRHGKLTFPSFFLRAMIDVLAILLYRLHWRV